MEKYGFIYLWFDRKHKRFYLGRHWGSIDDGYICSSNNMREAYKRRPEDFKRKLISFIYTCQSDLILEEQRWLNMIKKDDFGTKYYNKNPYSHMPSTLGRKHTESSRKKMSLAHKGRKRKPLTDDHKEKISNALNGIKHSEERKYRTSIGHMGQIAWNKGLKIGPMSDTHKEKLRKPNLKNSINLKGRVSPKKSNKTGPCMKNRKEYTLIDPAGTKITFLGLNEYAKEHGLSPQHLGAVASGKRKSHKGWTLE
jgi:hypothetical protein